MRQRGQAAVELAFIAPMFFLIFFSVIYAGILFMDYLQFSNAARAAARDITLASKTERTDIINKLNEQDTSTINKYANPLTSLYKPTFSVDKKTTTVMVNNKSVEKDVSVTVTITFQRTLSSLDLPKILNRFKFPPETLKPIAYTMIFEKDE